MGYWINNAVLDVGYECPRCGYHGETQIEGDEFVGNMFGLVSLTCEKCGYEMYDEETAEDYADEYGDDEDEDEDE